LPERASLLVTCEHGGHRVPREAAAMFRGRDALLESHRGWDAGALFLARQLARRTGAPLVATTVTRLLVEPNRSPHNPRVFSALTRPLPASQRRALLERYHRPHWERVERAIRAALERAPLVVHVAVHSFTPLLGRELRDFEVGLLYDPSRAGELAFCRAWAAELSARAPWLRVRRNAPYRGVADGLPTAMRRRVPAARYVGIELEVNQGLLDRRGRFPADVSGPLILSLQALMSSASRI
jgi:predicted N-formylglutamate amidohydrolase